MRSKTRTGALEKGDAVIDGTCPVSRNLSVLNSANIFFPSSSSVNVRYTQKQNTVSWALVIFLLCPMMSENHVVVIVQVFDALSIAVAEEFGLLSILGQHFCLLPM